MVFLYSYPLFSNCEVNTNHCSGQITEINHCTIQHDQIGAP